ncbi:MAG: NAD-dependent epimerase/dehydratase family protein [Sumerlaeia bacterium]
MILLPRRILHVGCTSHTGERLALRLSRLGVEVRGLTRDPASPVAKRLALAGIDIREGDCLRRWTLWEALEGCEALVSTAHIRYSPALVQACHRFSIERLVLTSSTRRFSSLKDPTAVAVINAELPVTESGLDWTLLRPTMIFGGKRDQNVERLVRWLSRKNWFPLFGGGKNQVQPIYVEDLVDALVAVLRSPRDTAKRDFNLAGPQPLTYRQFIEEIVQALDRDVRLMTVPVPLGVLAAKVLPGVHPDMIRRMREDKTFDIAPAREAFQFQPHPFRDAIRMKVAGRAEVEAIYAAASGDALPRNADLLESPVPPGPGETAPPRQ